MMKKLLVLVLVLGMTSLASAGLEWTTDTGIFDVYAGDTIVLTLNVTSPDEGTGISIGLLTDNDSSGDILDVSGAPAVWTSGDLGMSMADLESLFGADLGADTDWTVIDLIGTGEDARVTGAVLDVTYLVGADLLPNDIVVISATNLLDLATNHEVYNVGEIPDCILKVVPEPATLALLGLGGLFLRRRK